MQRFDWLASESAPKGFPMEVVSGHFYDKKGGSLYIPDGKTIHHGWGENVSVHIVGDDKKHLPERFDILCFSYAEDVFYGGSFELPYDKIAQYFKDGYYSPNAREDVTFREIIAGVAPGGHVSVWISGINKQIEVFSGQMDKVDFPWKDFLDNPNISREQYVQTELKESLNEQELNAIKNNEIPFGIWKEYSKRYPWKPYVTGEKSEELIDWMKFYNGEQNYFSVKHGNDWKNETLPVPTSFIIRWYTDKGKEIKATFHFDETEILKSFNEMAQQTDKPFVFHIDIKKDDNRVLYTTELVVDDITIPIKNTQVTHR